MAKENARAGKANTNTGAGKVKKLTKAQIKKYEKTAQGKETKTAAKKATAAATKETKVEAKADKKYAGKDNSKGDKPEAKKPAAKKVKKPAVKKPAAKKVKKPAVKKPAAKKPAAKVQTGTAPKPTTADPKVVKGKTAVEANKAKTEAKTEAKPKAKTKAVKTPAQRGVAAANKKRATAKAKATKAAKKLAKNSTKAAKMARYGGYALRAARVGTPIGAASLALEGLYRGGKYLKNKSDKAKATKLSNDIAVKEGRGKYVTETTGSGRNKKSVKVFKPVNKQSQGKGDGSMLVRKDYKKPVSKPTAKPVAKPTVKPVAKPAVTPTPTKTTTVKKSRFGAGNDKTISRKGKKLANVSKEQLKASGLSLNKYMNQWNKSGKRP